MSSFSPKTPKSSRSLAWKSAVGTLATDTPWGELVGFNEDSKKGSPSLKKCSLTKILTPKTGQTCRKEDVRIWRNCHF